MRQLNPKVSKYEEGSVLLFISAIVIPFLFFLLSLTLDFAFYFQEEKQVQVLLDKGGMYVQRFLPYIPQAEEAFAAYVSQTPALQAGATSFRYEPDSQSSDVLTLEYQRPFTPFFANLVGTDIGFPLVVRSQIRVTPFDIHLAVDTSRYMGPAITDSEGWNPSSERPSYLFQQGTISFVHDLDGDGIPTQVDPLVASQQCFSQPFLAHKRNAVRLYQYFASFRDNAVGLSVYPQGTGTQLVRSVTPSLIPGDASDVQLESWQNVFVRNEHCLAAAEREIIEESFMIPEAPQAFEGLWRSDPINGEMIDTVGGFQVSSGYEDFSPESIIWSQPVRRESFPESVVMLDSLSGQLLTAESSQTRGGVRNFSNRFLVVLAGDMPWHGGARLVNGAGAINPQVEQELANSISRIVSLVTQAPQLEFRLFYLSFFHQGLPGDFGQFQAGMNVFQQLSNTAIQGAPPEVQERVSVHVLSTEQPEELSDQVLSFLAMNRRAGVISR